MVEPQITLCALPPPHTLNHATTPSPVHLSIFDKRKESTVKIEVRVDKEVIDKVTKHNRDTLIITGVMTWLYNKH